MTNVRIHMVALGLGLKEHLTFGAEKKLRFADRVYVMAKPGSWMVRFVEEITGIDNVRTYMPESVAWNCGWQSDPIFAEIVNEVALLVAEEKEVVFAMAGDVAIFGNIADSIVPLLREKGLTWDVYPGVSFLNALSVELKEPIVGESDSFTVTSVKFPEEIDRIFLSVNTIVLYNPAGFDRLQEYIRNNGITYAKMVVHGVYGGKGLLVDLVENDVKHIRGLVVLRKPSCFNSSDKILSDKPKRKIHTILELENHLGLNGWDSQKRFFAVCYPDRLMWSPSGDLQEIEQRFHFPNSPSDIRGFFIDSNDNLFLGLKGFNEGSYGRSFVSRNAGKTFEVAFERNFWAMDEDKNGNLFAGVYHERNEPDGSCSILWSSDGGNSWVDIGAPEWEQQLHVHHLAVDPYKGWLYACLGDKSSQRGVWRSKIKITNITDSAKKGTNELYLEEDTFFVDGDTLVASSGAHLVVDCVLEKKIILKNPLTETLAVGTKIMKQDWYLKFAAEGNALQFIGICFKNGFVFFSDDNGKKRNPDKCLVYCAKDDGSKAQVPPEAVLKAEPGDGWGAFFLECDQFGRIWTGVRPVTGIGHIWVSDDGQIWKKVADALVEDIPCWRGTHTFRDMTLGQSGAGRFSTGPSGEMVVSYLNRALILGSHSYNTDEREK